MARRDTSNPMARHDADGPVARRDTSNPAARRDASGLLVRRDTGNPVVRRDAIGQVPRARTTYLPAPPPISIRPAPLAGPELPAAARGVRADATPGIVRRSAQAALTGPGAGPDVPRSALADSTAHLFRAARLADAPVRHGFDTTGATTVGPSSNQPIRRLSVDAPEKPQDWSGAEHQNLSPAELDEIVERVIDKIEQRVVEELERRGRHYSPGVF